MTLKSTAIQIVAQLQEAGHIAYFAGGWVRDFLLGLPSSDIDIATSASVEHIQALFPKTLPVGIQFGIVVVVENSHPFEVATFRQEDGHLDGRRPNSIEPTTPEFDAQRRDFTINGLFYDPLSETLYDYVEGQKDLQEGIIRAIGDPHERFLEDRLRMIRAVRYATRFEFPIHIDTEQAILSYAKSLFPSVAMERIWQELQKMSHSKHFPKSLIMLFKLGLLTTIFPILKDLSLNDLEERVAPLYCLQSAPLIAKLLFLFPDFSLEEVLELCDMLKVSNSTKELASFLHSAKNRLHLSLSLQRAFEPYEWAEFYAHPQSFIALEIHSFSQTDKASYEKFHQTNQQALKIHIERLRAKTPLVQAKDLMEIGIKPGIEMGRLLKEAQRISVNLDIHDKQTLMHRLQNPSS